MAKATERTPEPKVLTLTSAQRWHDWLARHHDRTPEGVWLRLFKKAANRKSPTYAEAVEVALCFGWIDGQGRWIVHQFPRAARAPGRASGHSSAPHAKAAISTRPGQGGLTRGLSVWRTLGERVRRATDFGSPR